MEEIVIAGQILMPMGGAIMRVDYVEWQNRAWIAPIWIETPDRRTRRPLRLIAPRMAPGFAAPPGPEMLQIFTQMPLPAPTLEQGHVPYDLRNLVEIVENPPVFIAVNGQAN